MNQLEVILTALDQCGAPMRWAAPATEEELDAFQTFTGVPIPAPIRRLLLLSNGMELNVPGTQFYTLSPVWPGLLPDSLPGLLEALWDHTGLLERRGFYPLGRTAFGDLLFLDVKTQEVVQWDHEADEEFLRWPNLEDYLDEELRACLE